jgi:predicted transcriptional regulator
VSAGSVPKTTRAERASQVQFLRKQGLLYREIAELVGISPSYVSALLDDPDATKEHARRESYRGVCEVCGGPTTGSEGRQKAPKLCKDCANKRQRATKYWTRERIIEAIQLFASEHDGRPPTATEWLRGPRDPRFPRTSSIYRSNTKSGRNKPFASWADAIEAAGFLRPKVGHKLRSRGQGGSNTSREYVVLHRNSDGCWEEKRVESFTPEGAIELAASEPGEYAVIQAKYFFTHNVEAVTKLAIVTKDNSSGE